LPHGGRDSAPTYLLLRAATSIDYDLLRTDLLPQLRRARATTTTLDVMTQSHGLVRVLLTTYNSGAYLAPLLDSVLGQNYEPLQLVVRDDGSQDATPQILADYATRFAERMIFQPGPNLGPAGSMFTIIREYARGCDWLSFADHDDVWYPGKIARAIETLSQRGPMPAMYTGRLRITDADLVPRGLSAAPVRPMCFRNALVENVAAGCTMVMNAAARDLLALSRDMTGVKWPDWWFYLVVSAFGDVVYDSEPQLDYRRHANNSVGSPDGWRRWREAWRLVSSGALVSQLVGQAMALRRNYGERLPPDSRRVLDAFLARPTSLSGRIRHALLLDVYRQRLLDGLVLRTALALSADPSTYAFG
jgi:glycosyltransferase involved in cell wall biosynthesis